MEGERSIDWHRLAIILEWLSFFLVTPEFVGEDRLKQISRLLERFGKSPFRLAEFLTAGRTARIRIEIPGKTDLDVILDMARQFPQLVVFFLAPAAVALGLAFLPWPFLRRIGFVLIGLAVAGQLLNWFVPDLFFGRLARAPQRLIGALLLVMLPTLSFQAWFYLPLAFLGYAALRLSDLRALRALLFGLGVATFTVSKLIDFLI